MVLGTAVDTARLGFAAELSADVVVDVEAKKPQPLVDDATDGYGADVVLECSGAAAGAAACLRQVKR